MPKILYIFLIAAGLVVAADASAATLVTPSGSTAEIPVTVNITGLALESNTVLCFGANANAETGEPHHACSTGQSGGASSGTCNLTGLNEGDVIHEIYAWSWTDCTDGVFSGNTWWNQSGLSITVTSSTGPVTPTSTTESVTVEGVERVVALFFLSFIATILIWRR